MKQITLILLLLYFTISVIGQNSLDKGNYSVPSRRSHLNLLGEVGGNGLLMSVGLEHER